MWRSPEGAFLRIVPVVILCILVVSLMMLSVDWFLNWSLSSLKFPAQHFYFYERKPEETNRRTAIGNSQAAGREAECAAGTWILCGKAPGPSSRIEAIS